MSPISQFPASNTGSEAVTYTSGTTAERPASPTVGSTYFNITLGELQIYENGTWTALQDPALPKVPTIVSTVDVATARPYNNAAALITYSQNPEGGYAATFTATSTPSSITQTSNAGTTITVTGLASNTAYTFTLAGTNTKGTSSSATSNTVTVTSVPQAPQAYSTSSITTTGLILTWTPGATGGKAQTYRIKNLNSGTSVTTSSTSHTFTGLSGSVSFEIYGVNANGDSLPLTTSSMVLAPYTLLATVTSSGTFTVPSGKTQLAFTAVGSGYNGIAGNTSNGGGGGNGAGAAIVWDFPATEGNTFNISIPGNGGGQTTITKSGQSQLLSVGSTVTVDSTLTNGYHSTANGGSAGTRGSNGNGPSTGTNGTSGSPLSYPAGYIAISGNQLANPGSAGGGGGGGGAFNEARVTVSDGPYVAYARYYTYYYYNTYYYSLAASNNNSSNGGAAGGTGVGAGGGGGAGMYVYAGSIGTDTVRGSAGSTYGGGGGGSGGISSGKTSSNAVGGAGQQGVVYVYGR